MQAVNKDDVKKAIAADPLAFYTKAAPGLQLKPDGGRWKACCPFHAETSPSFTVYADGGWQCFGSCNEGGDGIAFIERVNGLDFPEALKETAGIVGLMGTRDRGGKGDPTKRYAITNAGGELVAEHCRLDLPDGTKLVWWERGGTKGLKGMKLAQVPLYGLPALLASDPEAAVIVCEGEKACDHLRAQSHLLAVGTACGASATPDDEQLWPLVGHDVILWPDNDEAGRKHMANIGRRLVSLGAKPRLLLWLDAPAKGDAADFFQAGNDRTRLEAMIAAAEEWQPTPDNMAHLPETAINLATEGPDLLGFNATDTGNAEAFACLFGDRVRYDHRHGAWRCFSEHVWKADNDGELTRLVKQSARLRYTQAAKAENDLMRKWAFGSESRGKVEACLALARAEHPLADTGEGWDPDPALLGCPNGILDLRTCELRPGTAEDRITRTVCVEFDPRAECPLWQRFIEQVFGDDEGLINFVWRAAGYSITGEVGEQVFFTAYGKGSNGKSTFLNTLRYILSDYAADTGFATWEHSNRPGIPSDLAALEGRRFITASETGENSRLNEARIKAWSGGDPITARFLHHEFFTYHPVGKLWLAVNHQPRVLDETEGFWRRVRLVPFNVTFEGGSRDNDLKEKLMAESAGILRWLAEGAALWYSEGLREPDCVRLASAGWREEADPLADFLAEECCIGESLRVAAGDLFAAYCEWTDRNRVRKSERMSSTAFGTRIGTRFVRKLEKVSGKTMRVYRGLGLLSEPNLEV